MVAFRRRDRGSGPLTFVPILLANLVPLVGVVRFGWEPLTLVAIYTLEVLLSVLLASVNALFAQQRPPAERDGVVSVSSADLIEKRGSVEPVAWLPLMPLRNVPFAMAVIGTAVWCSLYIGVAVSETVEVVDVLTRPGVAVGVGSLLVGHVVETGLEYVHDRRYEDVSPYQVVETPARQAFFLTFVLFPASALGETTGGGVVLLGIVVLVKVVFEWSTFRATRDDSGGWFAGPTGATDPFDPIDVPPGKPRARVQTDRRTVLYTAVLRTLSRTAPLYVIWFGLVWVITLTVIGGADVSRSVRVTSAVVVLGSFLAAIGVKIGSYCLEYGPLEYRRYEDRLLAYDTWLDEPQWSVSLQTVRDVDVVADRLPDRLLETRTFAVTSGWSDDEAERFVGPVANHDVLLEALEVPAAATELQPIDRRLAICAASIVGAIALVPLAVAVRPQALKILLVYVGFTLPFVAFVQRLLWNRACRP